MLAGGPWGFGPNAAIKLNMMPTPGGNDLAVTFMVSMRELMSLSHNAFAHDLMTRAAQQMADTLRDYLNSSAFQREMEATVREELKAQVKQALADRVDDIVEDLLT